MIVVAAIAVWFAIDRNPPAAVNVADDTFTSADADVTSPLQGGLPFQPDTTGETGGNDTTNNSASTESENQDDWLVKGRVVFADDVPQSIRSWATEVMVFYHPNDTKPGEGEELYIELDEGYRFNAYRVPEEFGIKPHESLKPARWQVICSLDGDYADSLLDIEDESDISRLSGIITPKIDGRTVDFGDIYVGLNDYVPEGFVVQGRLVHTSGRPVAHSGPYYLWGSNEEDENDDDSQYVEAEFRTDSDGRFIAHAHADIETDTQLDQMKFVLAGSDSAFSFEEGTHTLSSPVRKGRLLEFGETTLGGALIEVLVKGGLTASTGPDGQPKIGQWGEYEGDCVEIDMESGHGYVYALALPQPFTTSILVVEGRYVWYAWANATGLYPEHNGVLLVRKGEVYRMELDFTEYPSIPLEITADEGEPQEVTVSWRIKNEEGKLADGSYYAEDNPRIPVVPDYETRIEVNAPDYRKATAVATPDTDKLVVKLVRDARPKAKLLVSVPAFPEAMSKKYDGRCDIYVRNDDNQSAHDVQWWKEPQEFSFEFRQGGTYSLYIDGGEPYGYPGGYIFGPVEIELKVGSEQHYEIPAIPTPPWSAPIKRVEVTARAGGNPVDLEAWVVYEGVDSPMREELENGKKMRTRGLPLSLKDDFDTYPVEFNRPVEGDEAELKIDFAHTVEVRVARNGESLSTFQVTATSAAGAKLKLECSSRANDGVAKLWFPQGAVHVEVTALGWEIYSKNHVVTPGNMLRIDATSNLVRLTVECAESDDSLHGDELPDVWRMEKYLEDIWEEWGGISGPEILTLAPALYRFVPWNGTARDAIEVDLRSGGDTSVRLPEIEAPTAGSVVLKFDVKQLGESWSEVEIRYAVTGHLSRESNEETYGTWCYATIVPDGIKLSGLPLNTEIAVWGDIWYENDDDEASMLLKPLRVTVSEEGQLVDATFFRGVYVSEEWLEANPRLVTGIDGLNLEMEGLTLSGRHEFTFHDSDGKVLLREWITLPEKPEDEVPLPAHVKARLEALGAIEPNEDD